MKLTNKRLVSILLCLAMVLAMLPMAVFAEAPTTLYLKPNSNWTEGSARFAAYFFVENGATLWVDMTDADGDGTYEVAVPAGDYDTVIFCRMNPATTDNIWENKWNQTGNLAIPTDGTNLHTIPNGQWDCGTSGTWSVYGTVVEVTDVTVYCVVTDWTCAYVHYWGSSTGDTTWPGNAMTLVENTTNVYTATVPSDAAGIIFNNKADGETGVETATVYVPADSNVYYNVLSEGWYADTDAVFCVAGDAGLCGSDWDAAGNQMTGNGDNVYSYVFNNVAAGTYALKVTNGSWAKSWGDENGVNGNYSITVDAAATVIVSFDAVNKVISHAVLANASVAPATLVEGDNTYKMGYGDINAVSATYTAEKAGTVTINLGEMTAFDSYSNTWGPMFGMMFNMQYALTINGVSVGGWELPYAVDVAAGETVTVALSSNQGNAAEINVNVAFAEYVPGAADIKWQVPTASGPDDDKIDLRLVSWVDTLDYSNVQFTMTLAGVTKTLDVETVYEFIYGEAYASYSPWGVFGEEANYFVTHTVTGVPAEYFNEEIEVTVSFYDLDGELVRTSETRTIVIADNWD